MQEIIVNLLENQRKKYLKQGKGVLKEEDVDNIIDVVIEQFKVIETDRDLSSEDIQDIRKEMGLWIRRNSFVKCNPGMIMAVENKYNSQNWISEQRQQWVIFNAFLSSLYKLSPSTVNNIDYDTDNIMNQLPNPKEYKEFEVIGLVMGAIQSGKTTSYCAVIDKALDCGFNIVIIFTGTLKNLRNQTQKRVERSCCGKDTITRERVGIGKYLNRIDVKMATSQDYRVVNKNKERIISGDVGEDTIKCIEYEEDKRLIFVCTRGIATIQKLKRWIQKQSFYNKQREKAEEVSVLIIGDECDQGMINTASTNKQATPINRAMREFFNMFDKKVYLGYTATPFANIFIEPNPVDVAHLGLDFFPKDFIYLLEPANNYIGPNEFFGKNSYPYVVQISDTEQLYDKDKVVVNMPESLRIAINHFILVGAIRELRKTMNKNHSMLINIEPAIEPQNKIFEMVKEYIRKLRDDVENNKAGYFIESIQTLLKQVKIKSQEIKEKDREKGLVSEDEYDFLDNQIIEMCKWYLCERDSSGYKLKLMEINSTTTDELNYDKYSEEGLHVIAVGGYKLSRGYTLEGLTVSYFLRKSVQADTQLQTCRWFGYADDYRDLIVLYTTKDIYELLQGCTLIDKHFTELIKEMAIQRKTPKEFGLYIERIDGRIKATAPNKMRSSKRLLISDTHVPAYKLDIDISNFYLEDDINRKNLKKLQNWIKGLGKFTEEDGYFVLKQVDIEEVVELINNITICPTSRAKNSYEVTYSIKCCVEEQKLECFDVIIVTNKEEKACNTPSVSLNNEIEVNTMKRTGVMEQGGNSYKTTGGRALTVRHLRYGLTGEEVDNIESTTGKKFTETSVPNIQAIADERQKRKVGVMIIYIYDINTINKGLKKWNKDVKVNPIGFHIALPGNRKSTKKTVFANRVYIEELLRIMHEEGKFNE